MKIKDLQPRILYPARLSVNIEGEIKSLPDLPPPRKAKGVYYHQINIARNVKWPALGRRNIERETDRDGDRDRERNTGIKKNVNKKYLSIIAINVNGLNAPVKTLK